MKDQAEHYQTQAQKKQKRLLASPTHCLLIFTLILMLTLTTACTTAGTFPSQPAPTQTLNSPPITGCPLFPSHNIWNTDISQLPVHSNSANFIQSIGLNKGLHPDFGSGLYDDEPIGIPYTIVPGNQRLVPVDFDYADESDPGPYPIPPNVSIEGGQQTSGERNVVLLNRATCTRHVL